MAVLEDLDSYDEMISTFRILSGIGAFGAVWFVRTNTEAVVDQRQSRRTRISTRSVIQDAYFPLASLKQGGNQLPLVICGSFPNRNILSARYGWVGLDVIIVVNKALKILIT